WGSTGTNKTPAFKRFLSEVKQGRVPVSWWSYKDGGHNQAGKQELNSLINNNGFDTPKPSRLIKLMLQISTKPNDKDIILDFFAGSSSTAQAMLELNRFDDGNRQFLLVQLPEPNIEKSLARRSGFVSIADIGKERIRRVIAKMKAEDEGKFDLSTRDTPEDLGFKVFKLTESHFKPWSGTAEAESETYATQMALFNDPLMEGWTPAGVITEIALKEGYALTSRIERAAVAGYEVFKVSDPDKGQQFHVCLDATLSSDVVAVLGLGVEDLFICRDVALDDTTAANLALQCRLKVI
ncbi:MAG: DNA methyltransferase, partial [Chloroflexota bacterium]